MAKKIGIILLVFVCFYMGAHFYLRWKNSAREDVTKVAKLVDCDANKVRALKIAPPEAIEKYESSEFTRVDKAAEGVPAAAQLAASEWRITKPVSGEADGPTLVRIASMFCDLYDPAHVSPEEFKHPAAKLTVEVEGQGEHVLWMGPATSDRMVVSRHRAPDGTEQTVKIPPNLLQVTSLKPAEYLNLRVLRMSADNVNSVSVFEGEREKFKLERQGDGWRVLSAGKDMGAGSEEARKFVNRLSTLKAVKADEKALSPTHCERGTSRMSVELVGVGDRKEALYFQYSKNKKGPVSACNTARDALFTVHQDFIPYLETPLERMRAAP